MDAGAARRPRAVPAGPVTGVVIVLVAVVLALAGGAGVARADSGLVAAQPSVGTQLAGGPAGVRLQFAAPLEARFLVVEFWSDGRLDSLPARIDPTDPQAAIAAVRRTVSAAGVAWVRWRALTTDGHVFTGRYPVRIGTGGTTTPAPAQLGTTGAAWATGVGRLAILVGLVVALGLVVLRWGIAAPAWAAGV